MIVTRLPFKPGSGNISTPVPSDFNETGMFSNFTVFTGFNFSLTDDDPGDTFCSPCVYTSCVVNGTAFLCPYIMLTQNTLIAVLKFDNGTHVEPLFFGIIQSLPGYNGTNFDFEYLVPAEEDYYFYIYQPNLPPNVTIINPQPITYSTTSVPLVYNVTDDGTLDTCWYVLDATTVILPSCGPSVTLSVSQGTHTLTLYANDTLGAIGSDSVTFAVSIPGPPGPPPSTGPAGTPYYPPVVPPPPRPPPPPELEFEIIPEEIYVTVDYPQEGSAEFTVTSNIPLEDLDCFVTGDFSEYTTVELDSDNIEENGTVGGTIIVNMPPVDILDYDGDMEGILQCTGIDNETMMPSKISLVHLILNKPRIEVENVTMDILPGENKTGVLPITNTGDGNATAVNISAEFHNYAPLFEVTEVPETLGPGQEGSVRYVAAIPEDMAPGSYNIRVDIYENGRLVGSGYLILRIGVPEAPVLVCYVPDLEWTLLILIIGLITSVWIYKIKSEKEGEIVGEKEETRFDKYRRPLAYALLTMTGFFIVWALMILFLMTCEYIEPGDTACAATEPEWALVILIIGLILSFVVFKIKLDKESKLRRPRTKEWEKYKLPIAYALAVFIVFFIIWVIVLLTMTRCV